MSKVIYFASSNEHKTKEIQDLLGASYHVENLTTLGLALDVPETGTSFKENAYIKAKFLHDLIKKPVIADDSGLCVDILNGEPGIYSARYAVDHDDKANNAFLLKELSEFHEIIKRTAHYETVFCFLDDGMEIYSTGRLDGYIGFEEKGTNGFSYDTLFVPLFKNNEGKTYAEMEDGHKEAISQRIKSIKKIRDHL